MVTDEEKRKVKKSPNHAVCWAVGWSTPEVITAPKGRCQVGTSFVTSRVAKRTSFLRFLQLYKNESGKREGFVDLAYQEAKNLATSYQVCKIKTSVTASQTYKKNQSRIDFIAGCKTKIQ